MKETYRLFVLMVTVVARVGFAQGPAPIAIPDRPSCAACRIVTKTVAVISDDGIEGDVTGVESDSRGRFWIAQAGQLVRVYAPNGKFLRTLGRKGSGPDEWQAPHGFSRIPGDSMLVFDAGNARTIVVDSALRAIRTLRFSGEMFPIIPFRWPSEVLVHGIMRTAAHGFMLHLASFKTNDAVVTKSFGYDEWRAASVGLAMSRMQRVGMGRDGFWSMDVQQYRISQWSASGTRIQTLVRHPNWFPGMARDGLGSPTTPPPPRALAIWQAPSGLVWTVSNIAATTWAEGWPKLSGGTQDVATRQMSMEKLYRTAVEVIDPVAQKVVARTFLDVFAVGVLSDGRLAVYSVDQNGAPHLSIQSLTLQ